MAAVDFGALGQVVWVSLVAGVGVTVLFSTVIYGLARAGEARRAGLGSRATAFSALATVAAAVFCAVVVLGVAVMLDKG